MCPLKVPLGCLWVAMRVFNDACVLFRPAGISQDAPKSPLRCPLGVAGRAFGESWVLFEVVVEPRPRDLGSP